LAFSYWIDKPWFLTEGKLLLCSSYLPLRVPNWSVIYINTGAISRLYRRLPGPAQEQLQEDIKHDQQRGVPWYATVQTRYKLTAQQVDGCLEALRKTFLHRLGFGLALVEQLLILCSIGFKLGYFSGQTVDFSLQRRVISFEVVNLGLQR
jgi:hypothetical protein